MSELNWFSNLCLATAATCALVLTSCNSSTDNPGKAPRVTAIPSQGWLGGATFQLKLTKYVTDPNNQTLTFTVNSGGGTVTTGTYSHVFATVGSKTVTMTVSNGVRTTDFSFVVVIETGHQAVVQAGTSLVLLDRSTVTNASPWVTGQLYSSHFMTVSNSQGYTDTYKAGLNRGHLIYERAQGSQTDLYVFDAFDPETVQLGDDPDFETDEKFQGETSDNRVIFTSGTATDTDLYIFNAITELTREIRAVKGSHERNAVVDSSDYVYFESGPSAQRDIYIYNPSKDELDPVSTSTKNEVIRGVVTGGGVVFTRDEGAGDVDLWYYKPGVGLTQVAADVSTSGFQARTLDYNGSTSDGKVVFTENVSGTDTNLYYWDSGTLTTTTVSANLDVHDVFDAVTTNAKIIYTHQVSGSDWDVHARTVAGPDVDVDLSGTTAKDTFQALTALNDVVFFRGANDMHVYDDSAESLLGADTGGSLALTLDTALTGGNVVYSKKTLLDVDVLHRWDVSNVSQLVSATGTFAGAMDNGTDFVIKNTVSGQDDLFVWRETGDSIETISTNGSDEKFVVSTAVGNGVVFSRNGGNDNYDLYVWTLATGVRQLTSTEHSHTLAGTFFLDNR